MVNMKSSLLALNFALICSIKACVFHGGADVQSLVKRGSQPFPSIQHRTQPPSATQKVAIINVRIFDGTSFLIPGAVIIDGGVIGSIVTVFEGGVDQVINGNGGVLLPGLIDAHCHPGSIDDLTALSSYGVTTAIGMACLSYEVCNSLRNQTGLTNFISTGIAAAAPGAGHSRLFNTPIQDTVSSPSQVPEFVANLFSNNSDFLKMVAEPGGLDQATLNALVTASHKTGHSAMTHAADFNSYSQAIASLTDGIQHVPVDLPLTTAMAQNIIANKQYVTPTLNVLKFLLSSPIGISLAIPGSNYSNAATSVRVLHDAGVPILAGTDSFVSPTIPALAIPFGVGMHNELEYLVEAGLTPLQALNAATTLAARLHSLPDRGVIAPGKRADLLLIQGNPLTNISNTRNIVRVWNAGIPFTPVA